MSLKRRFKTVKWIIRSIAFLLGLLVAVLVGTLYILEKGVPESWVKSWLARIPADACRVEVDAVLLSLVDGIRLQGIRLWLPGQEGAPLVDCAELHAEVSWFASGGIPGKIRSLSADRLVLPLSALDPSDTAETTSPSDSDWSFAFPKSLKNRVVLVNPDIFSIRVERVEGILETDARGVLHLRDARVLVKSAAERVPEEYAGGEAFLDLIDGVVGGKVDAFLYPRRIDGLFKVLEIPEVIDYTSAFELTAPVKADCVFKAGLRIESNLCEVLVNAQIPPCTYNGVPLHSAAGPIQVKNESGIVLTIGPLNAAHAAGGHLKGMLSCNFVTDVLSFEADSIFPLLDLYALLDLPFTQQIPEMRFTDAPRLTIKGSVPLDGTPANVRLDGMVKAGGGGDVMKFPFETVSTPLLMSGGTFSLPEIKATLRHGGTLEGQFNLLFPADPLREDEVDFNATAALDKTELSDLLLPFSAEDSQLAGSGSKVAGSFTLSGTFFEDAAKTLASFQGKGQTTLSEGHLNRLPVFAGLTDLIAENVPGVKSITDQSNAKSEFTIVDGIVKTKHLEITGSFFSVEGKGTYSLPDDALDFSLIVGVFKKESLIGNVTRWVTVPVSRLLMEFAMTGSLSDPKWHRKGTIKKISDTIF